jgi:CheY-like chemotaxis protein
MITLIEFLKAVAGLAWPVLAAIALVKLFPYIRAFLGREKITFKIGSMEITGEQAAESLANQVNDLQTKFIQLEKNLAMNGRIESDVNANDGQKSLPKDDRASVQAVRPRRILWVDDFPSNNAIQIEKLNNDGFTIDIATNTNSALQLLDSIKYDLIISDMGRIEYGVSRPAAGLLFAQELRAHSDIPFVIFASAKALSTFGEEIRKLGIKYSTNSTIDLYRIIETELGKK